MSITNKKKVICHIPTGNQFENIKPIEVKCFLDENQVKIETYEKILFEEILYGNICY